MASSSLQAYGPSDWQMRYLTSNAFGSPNTDQEFQAWTPYGGPLTAPWNQAQDQAYLRGLNGYGSIMTQGGGLMNRGGNVMDQGARAFNRGNNLMNNYGLAQGGYKHAMGQGNSLMGGFGGAADYYSNAAQTDPFQFAAQAANNPQMDGMVDAASRDVVRNLGENTLPGIAGQSASAGALGSSRRGMLEGIATRGAADRIADIGANLRGNAYQQGIGQGLQQGQFGAQGLQGLGQLGMNQYQYGNTGLYNVGNAGQNLYGLGGTLAGQGAGIMNIGANMYGGANTNLLNLGGARNQWLQDNYDRQQQHHYYSQQLPMEQAERGMGVLLPWGTAFGKQKSGAMTGKDWIGAGLQLGGTAIGALGGPTGAAAGNAAGQAASDSMGAFGANKPPVQSIGAHQQQYNAMNGGPPSYYGGNAKWYNPMSWF